MQRRKEPPSMLELCEIIKRRHEQMWGPMDDDTDEGNSSFRRTERTSSGQQPLTMRANDLPTRARQLVFVMANQRSGSSGFESDSRVPTVIAVSKSRYSFIEFMGNESTSVDVDQQLTASQSEFQQFQMTEADGGYHQDVFKNGKFLRPQYAENTGKRNFEMGSIYQRKWPDATHDDNNGKKKIVAVEGCRSSAPQRNQTHGRKVKSSDNAIKPPLVPQPAVNGVASSHPPIWRAASPHRPMRRAGVITVESLHPDHPEQHESQSVNSGRRFARQEICRETSPRKRRIGIHENNDNDRAERTFLRVLSKRF